jgi:general secretion pathway protein F
MAVFAYTATGTEGTVNGTITADTPRQARDLLRERGLVVQRVADHKERTAARLRLQIGKSRLANKTVQFVRELSTLLGVGTPLLEAMDVIAKQHEGRFLAVIQMLRDRVAAGISLAEAMREQPDVFDEMTINMVETGEDAGNLEHTLSQLADFRERGQRLKGRVSTALIYPAIVLVMAFGAMLFLMTVVVPRVIEPLVEQGQELPTLTVIVKAISDFLIGYWWLLAVVMVGAAMGAASVLRTKRGRWTFHRTLLKTPFLGDLIRKQAIVRISVVIGTLIKSGVVFVRAIQIAQRSTRNVVIRDALERVERAVVAGGDIAEGLEETKAFPPMVVQVFSVGQQSGRLEEMLERLAKDYDAQVDTAAQRLAAVIEPVLIVFLAVIVVFIVLATMLPILEAGNVLQ